MTPHKSSLPRLYLKQCEMSILDHPALISTILGSCVAVTLYNSRLGIAAISHALLPHCRRHTYVNSVNDLLTDDCSRCNDAFKYVDCSVSMMAETFARFGIRPAETQVQLYGGAKMFISGNENAPPSVGLQNSTVAKQVIADHGLTLFASDIGGSLGRKLYFNTQTGKVTLHRMAKHPLRDFRALYPLKKVGHHASKEKNPGPRR